MALSLKSVPASHGALWVRDAFKLFARKPLAFTGLFMVFLFVVLLSMLVPVVGGLVQLMLPPLLSLGFMVASLSALHGGTVQPGQYIEPLRTDGKRRRALIALCGIYGLSVALVVWSSNVLSGGQLAQLFELLGSNDPSEAELNRLLADPDVLLGVFLLLGGGTLLSVPYWHAPALVHWGGQGLAQALFSSTLAVWRAKGAFLVYSLVWLALVMGFGILSAVVLGLVGAPKMAVVMAFAAGLLFSTVFYVSLLFTFNDSFGDAQALAADMP
jgi:hypothetical protein